MRPEYKTLLLPGIMANAVLSDIQASGHAAHTEFQFTREIETACWRHETRDGP